MEHAAAATAASSSAAAPVATPPAPPPPIRARAVDFAFDEPPIPRYWFGGNALATHIANGVNLLFPAGERFFVRAVRHYLDRVTDEGLRERVKGFFGQEGRHAHAHDEFSDVLEAQGYDVKAFLAWYERVAYGMIERVSPPALRLSVTVALEHYTAIMAENALRERMLDHAHPTLRALLLWHAAEEIEHRAVAFDVLAAVNPSYALRMAGLAVATPCLLGFWIAATVRLLRADGLLSRARLRENAGTLHREHPIGQRVFLRGIREYIKRDFHPAHNDVDGLAREYLASAGLA